MGNTTTGRECDDCRAIVEKRDMIIVEWPTEIDGYDQLCESCFRERYLCEEHDTRDFRAKREYFLIEDDCLVCRDQRLTTF